MAGGKEYAVVLAIKAADYATGPIRAVVGRLAAIRGQVSAIGRSMGMNHVTDALGGVRRAASGVAGHIQGVLGPALAASGLGAMASAAGLWELTRSAADNLDALGELSDRTGVGAQRLREWQFAAQRAGASNADLESGLNKLNTNMGQAVNGTGKGKEVFAALGIKLKDASGHAKNADTVMMELADKMAKIKDPAQRAAIASTLLGKQAGITLAPMLAKGRAGLEEWFQTAREFGTVTDEQVQAAGEFNDSMDDLSRGAKELSVSIGAKLFPHLKPLVDGIKEWIKANAVLLTAKVEEFVKRLADGLKQVDWSGVVNGIFAFVESVQRAVDFIGGWSNALAGVAVVMASGPIMATMNLVGAIAKLGLALGGLAAKFALAFAGGVVGMIGSFVMALRSGLSVMTAMNIAMAANPVGAIIVGITALVALGVTLYNTWEPFRKMIDWIVAKVVGLAKGVGGFVAKKLGFDVGGDAAKADKPAADGSAAAPSSPASHADATDAAPTDMHVSPQAAPQPMIAPPVAVNPAAKPSGIAPPVAVNQNRAEITLRILSDAPVKMEGIKQQGSGLTVRADLPTGKGRAATG